MYKSSPNSWHGSSNIINLVKVESIGRGLLSVVHFIAGVIFAVGTVRADFKIPSQPLAYIGLFTHCEADQCETTDFKPEYIRVTERLYCVWAAASILTQAYLIVTTFSSIRIRRSLVSTNLADTIVCVLMPIVTLATFGNLVSNSSYCGKYGDSFFMSYFSLFVLLIVYISLAYMASHKRLMSAIINYTSRKYQAGMAANNAATSMWPQTNFTQAIPQQLILNNPAIMAS